MTYALLNKLLAKPDQRSQVVDILLESGKLFSDNPACFLYMVSEATEDPTVIWVADVWTSKESHEEALKATGTAAIRRKGHAAAGGHARADRDPTGGRRGTTGLIQSRDRPPQWSRSGRIRKS